MAKQGLIPVKVHVLCRMEADRRFGGAEGP